MSVLSAATADHKPASLSKDLCCCCEQLADSLTVKIVGRLHAELQTCFAKEAAHWESEFLLLRADISQLLCQRQTVTELSNSRLGGREGNPHLQASIQSCSISAIPVGRRPSASSDVSEGDGTPAAWTDSVVPGHFSIASDSEAEGGEDFGSVREELGKLRTDTRNVVQRLAERETLLADLAERLQKLACANGGAAEGLLPLQQLASWASEEIRGWPNASPYAKDSGEEYKPVDVGMFEACPSEDFDHVRDCVAGGVSCMDVECSPLQSESLPTAGAECPIATGLEELLGTAQDVKATAAHEHAQEAEESSRLPQAGSGGSAVTALGPASSPEAAEQEGSGDAATAPPDVQAPAAWPASVEGAAAEPDVAVAEALEDEAVVEHVVTQDVAEGAAVEAGASQQRAAPRESRQGIAEARQPTQPSLVVEGPAVASVGTGLTALSEHLPQTRQSDREEEPLKPGKDDVDTGSLSGSLSGQGEEEPRERNMDQQLNREADVFTEYITTDFTVDHIESTRDEVITIKPEAPPSPPGVAAEGPLWEVVGGAGRGGVVVREGQAISSSKLSDRLATGSCVEGVMLQGERLQYRLLSGTGPSSGWVSIKLKGKDLLLRKEQQQDEQAASQTQGIGNEAGAMALPRLVPWRGAPLTGSAAWPRFGRACVMGAHHCGTNALVSELQRFFHVQIINEHRRDNPHLWKHTVIKWPPPLPEDVLCICLVRDPAMWIQSLGRDPMRGTFYEICPLRRRQQLSAGFEAVPPTDISQLFGRVAFDDCEYCDALDLWESTVRGYLDERALPSAQTVVLRNEDVIISFKSVMQALARYGLEWREDAPALEPLETAVKDNTHPRCTRRVRSEVEKDYRNLKRRYKGLTAKQRERLQSLDRRLTQPFGYDRDDVVSTWIPKE